MMLIVISLLAFLSGFLACSFLFQKEYIALSFSLSLPVGIAVISTSFIVLNFLHVPVWMIFTVQVCGLVLMSWIQRELLKTFMQGRKLGRLLSFQEPLLLVFKIVFFYALLITVGVFFVESVKEPHGMWDAFNFWNLKAKIIARSPENWSSIIHRMNTNDFHPDYPLLQSGFIAYAWMLMEEECVWIPILVSFVFTFGAIALLTTVVGALSNQMRGLIAGLVLLCTPFYMPMGYSQYADNTVGFFYLAVCVLFVLARNNMVAGKAAYMLAGFLAGAAAWTKNEGLLFVVCVSGLLLVRWLFAERRKEFFLSLRYIFYGLLPVLLLVVYFKTVVAPPNDIFVGQQESAFKKLTDFSRYTLIANWWFDTFGTFGKWSFNPWWLFLVVALYKGVNVRKHNNEPIIIVALLLLMLGGFFMIYLITPLDLKFHLSTSTHRLFFQLFPTFIFLYTIVLEEASGVRKLYKYAKEIR